MSGNSAFDIITVQGWRRGFGNMLRVEFSRWWKTRTWWTQTLIWVSVIDLILFAVASEVASEPGLGAVIELALLYGIFGGMFASVSVVIIMQGAIVGEKITGTASWILSKPISRTAFVVSKLIANMVGVYFTAGLVPGVVAYFIISGASPDGIPFLNFMAGNSVIALYNFFFLAFTLMLGAFYNSRGPVIGFPLFILLGQQFIITFILKYTPWLYDFLPYQLVMPPNNSDIPSLSTALINGLPVDTWVPVYSTLILIVVFTVLGVWRFRREEF